jgi:hypothetical protein
MCSSVISKGTIATSENHWFLINCPDKYQKIYLPTFQIKLRRRVKLTPLVD